MLILKKQSKHDVNKTYIVAKTWKPRIKKIASETNWSETNCDAFTANKISSLLCKAFTTGITKDVFHLQAKNVSKNCAAKNRRYENTPNTKLPNMSG